MSRRQAIPSNWFVREADPLPPLFPIPSDGDHYYNSVTGKLRVFADGRWLDAVGITGADGAPISIIAGDGLTGGGPLTADVTLAINTTWADARYVNSDQFYVGTSATPPNPTPPPAVGTVYIQY